MKIGKDSSNNLRLYNEENRDYEVRRAQLYLYHGFNLSFYILAGKYGLFVFYQWLIGRTRYIRDTYKEIDIGCLPPGEVLQTTWNGINYWLIIK